MQKLIILGAGASVDFGFPIGLTLCEEVHSAWQNPSEFYLRLFCGYKTDSGVNHRDSERIEAASIKIKNLSDTFFYSGALSIDEYLSQSTDSEETRFGKSTIIDLILKKERDASYLIPDTSIFKWKNNWLRILFSKEFKFNGVPELREKLRKHPVKFITFNYDRSVEHFIFNAIKNYYRVEQKEAVDIYSGIEFYHVYGKLAPLEWESIDQETSLKFGDHFDGNDYMKVNTLRSCVDNIKVINEDRDKEESRIVKNRCKDWIHNSDRVYILGFGFLKSNWELLGIEEDLHSSQSHKLPRNKFFYTTHGLSENLKSELQKKFNKKRKDGENAQRYDHAIFEYLQHHY